MKKPLVITERRLFCTSSPFERSEMKGKDTLLLTGSNLPTIDMIQKHASHSLLWSVYLFYLNSVM
jgi:hypothetical protein